MSSEKWMERLANYMCLSYLKSVPNMLKISFKQGHTFEQTEFFTRKLLRGGVKIFITLVEFPNPYVVSVVL